jgi:hypothetical protein
MANVLNQSSTDEELIQGAIEGVKSAQIGFERDPKKWLDEHGPIPPNVPLPGGSHLWITKEGLNALRCFGAKWLRNNPQLKKGLNAAIAKSWAVEAFGRLIAEVRSGQSQNKGSDDCIPVLKSFLAEWAQKRFRTFVYYFPCYVSRNEERWAIGPVTIIPRAGWLDEVVSESGGKSKSWVDAIRPQWAAGLSELPKACETLSPREQLTARVALTDGPSPSVAKVVVEASEVSRAKERARIAASLAVDSIGLVLDSFSALTTVRGPDDEIRPRLEHIFSQERGQEVTWSSHLDVPSGGAPARRVLAQMARYVAGVGEILEVLTKQTPSRGTPELDQRWLNALYWFGKARREKADFLSISLMGAALDILTKGKYVKGIKALAAALFGNTDNTVIASDGRTQGELLEAIYDKTRSQFAHGSVLGLLAELPIERADADVLASAMLVSYFELLSRYRGADDYESFKKWIPGALVAAPPP